MTLGELTRVFSNETYMIITVLYSDGSDEVIYKGQIYGYGRVLKRDYVDGDFKNYRVVNVEVVRNMLNIVIEE